MDTIEKIIQFSENMEYPDGFNAITIESSGDTPGIEVFPVVSVTLSKNETSANGTPDSWVDVYAEIWDIDPAELTVREFKESASASDPFTVSAGNQIDEEHDVFLHEWDGVDEDGDPLLTGALIPIDWIDYETNEIHIDESYRQDFPVPGIPPTEGGLVSIPVALHYWGGNTISFSIEGEIYKEKTETEEEKRYSVGGVFDPNKVLASTRITTTFKPEVGTSGSCNIEVTYKNGKGTAPLKVGHVEDNLIALSMGADPSSVRISEPSLITLEVVYDGEPVVGEDVTFAIYEGEGVLSRLTATLELEEDLVEVLDSPDLVSLTVSKPISVLTQIKDVPKDMILDSATYSLDPEDTTNKRILGTFEPNIPYEVTYDGGGKATCTFTTSVRDGNENGVTLLGWYKGKNAYVVLEIADGIYVEEGLSMEADPTEISAPSQESVIICYLVDEEGNPEFDINVHYWVTSGPGTVTSPGSMDRVTVEAEDATVTDAYVVSVSQPTIVGDSASILYNGVTYSAVGGNGNTLILSEAFPPEFSTPVPCVADYTTGKGEGIYTAPVTLSDKNVIVMGQASDGERKSSVNLQMGEGTFPGSLTIEPDPSSITVYGKSILTVTLLDEPAEPTEGDPEPVGDPVVDANVTVALKEGDGGKIAGGKQTIVTTGEEGEAKITYTPAPTIPEGNITVLASYGGLEANCSVSIVPEQFSEKRFIKRFHLRANTGDGVYDKSDELNVISEGALAQADQWGCVNGDYVKNPIIVKIQTSGLGLPPTDYVETAIIEGGAELVTTETLASYGNIWEIPNISNLEYPTVYAAIEWPSETVNKSFYVFCVDDQSGQPLVEATVTLSGDSQTKVAQSDGYGKATFTDLTPGITYTANIESSNHIPNVKQEGSNVFDVDPENDRVVVPDRYNCEDNQLNEITISFDLYLNMKKRYYSGPNDAQPDEEEA